MGNAFEYLLSVLGSQGEAGQFRTPRHIIDFIVDVVDPKKGETVLDPACGTAGFLISSYKNIVKHNSSEYKEASKDDVIIEGESAQETVSEAVQRYSGDKLTPDDKARIASNFVGYDISPDMVKLSLVNMYLHDFNEPRILEYDTLTSEKHWDETFDVILANPPFMTPKGGIQPHNRFQIQANRSEVLFVDYIAEHLNIKGRAGVIVPEGIIFQSSNAYKNLRKMLVEDNYLWAVVSLPAGVFNPYSGVKTSVLIFDKQRAKKMDEILFVKIENDGFDLGAQRRKIEKNDLPEALEVISLWKVGVKKEGKLVELVAKQKIAESGDYNLTGDRYKAPADYSRVKWPMVKLEEVLDYEQPTKYIVTNENYSDSSPTPVLTAGKSFILGYTNENHGIFRDDLPVIIFDDFTTANKYVDFPFKVKSSAMKILHPKKERADVKFLFYVMQKIVFSSMTHKRYWISQYSKIQIPLPPLEVQEQIVAELDGYQKVIDGARQVVNNWKPNIKIDPEWPMVKLSSIVKDLETGVSVNSEKYPAGKGEKGILKTSAVTYGFFNPNENKKVLDYEISRAKVSPRADSIIISRMNTPLLVGASAYLEKDYHDLYLPDRLWQIVPKNKNFSMKFLFFSISSDTFRALLSEIAGGTSGSMKNISKSALLELEISLPDVTTQQKIVAKIETERKTVDECKKLIEIHEQKIKEKIAEVWGRVI